MDRITEVSDGSPRKALVLLNQVVCLKTEADQLDCILKSDTSIQAIEIAKAMINRSTWEKVSTILKGVEDDPEGVRRLVLAYATKVLLGGGAMAPRAYLVIEAFKFDFFNSGKAGLAAACFEVINQK